MTLPSPQGGIPTKITKYSVSWRGGMKKCLQNIFTSNSRKFLIAPRTISKGIFPKGFNSTSTFHSKSSLSTLTRLGILPVYVLCSSEEKHCEAKV